MAQLVEKLLERRRAAFRLHLYRAIVSVAHVALKPQLAGVPLGKETKADTLNVAEDLRLEAAPFLFSRQSCVRQWPGGDDHGNALRRIRDRLQGPANDRQIRLD
jgi:hypothetical protein